MTAETKLWVLKAEADFDAVLLLRKSRKRGRHDLICFHAQQCAEKYLKAILQELGEYVPKTHDLSALLKLVLLSEPLWSGFEPELARLSNDAVAVPYPDVFADAARARRSVKASTILHRAARDRFGLADRKRR
jgi:HEPN domain-containing protein